MSAQSNKAKGRRHQKQVKSILHDYWPHLEDGDIDWQSMGSGGKDIILSPKAEREIPFDIECKYGNSAPWKPGFEQAEENADEDRVPLLIRREPYEDNLIVMRLTDLLDLKGVWGDADTGEIKAKLKKLISQL